jgi:hypothetical protein
MEPKLDGAVEWIRTTDLLIANQLLQQLTRAMAEAQRGAFRSSFLASFVSSFHTLRGVFTLVSSRYHGDTMPACGEMAEWSNAPDSKSGIASLFRPILRRRMPASNARVLEPVAACHHARQGIIKPRTTPGMYFRGISGGIPHYSLVD